MSLPPGTRLGSYRIESPLGAGGMGEVYRAHDTNLGREVAVKVLAERLTEDAGARRRFEHEARAVAALSHPNILSIFDFGTAEGVAYAVSELLEGETLRVHLVGGVTAGRAVEIARDLARGLAAAHDKGIVHRDLKPENVFVTKDGRVKILDFGLAKSAAPPPPEGASAMPTVEQATEPGTVLGTAGYMSPEQVRAQPLDHRTDIFALGAILYEMLAGRRAFSGGSSADVFSAILREEPPPFDSAARGISQGLEMVVRRCLDKSPARRFQSAADVGFALEALSQATGVTGGAAPASRPGHERRARVLVPALAAAVGLALGLAAARLLFVSAPAPRMPGLRFLLPPEPGSPFTGMLALSHDGGQLAFVASGEDGNDRLFLRPLAALQARVLGGTEGAAFPFFSPDGKRLAFFTQHSLKTIDLASGNLQTLCPAPHTRGGTWSPEGTILFAPRAGAEIARVPATGGAPKTVFKVSQAERSLRWPVFLPDGRTFTYLSSGGQDWVLRAATLEGGEARVVTRADSGAVLVPGGLLYTLGTRLVSQPFDVRARTVAGTPRAVAEDVLWDVFATGLAGFAASANGVVAYLSGGVNGSRLAWYDRTGRRQGTVGPTGAFFEPTLSPDGKSLAISRGNPEHGFGEIWLVDLERGGMGRLSHATAGPAVTPLFSPDGRQVAYSTFPHGRVFVRDVSGAGEARPLFECGSFCILEDWAPDGSIFYVTLDLATFTLKGYVRPAGGGAARPLGSAAASLDHARLSPDGRWLAYVSEEAGVSELQVRSYPEATERFVISAGGGSQPYWRADGRELFYVTSDRKLMSVPIALAPRFAPGKPQALFQSRILPEVESRNHYTVTPDGQRFLVNERPEEDASRPVVVIVE